MKGPWVTAHSHGTSPVCPARTDVSFVLSRVLSNVPSSKRGAAAQTGSGATVALGGSGTGRGADTPPPPLITTVLTSPEGWRANARFPGGFGGCPCCIDVLFSLKSDAGTLQILQCYTRGHMRGLSADFSPRLFPRERTCSGNRHI